MHEMTDGEKERVEELERELETWKERFEDLSQKVCGGEEYIHNVCACECHVLRACVHVSVINTFGDSLYNH